MGTLIEDILSRKAGQPVQAGEIVLVDVDYIMSHDNTTPLAIKAFREASRLNENDPVSRMYVERCEQPQ